MVICNSLHPQIKLNVFKRIKQMKITENIICYKLCFIFLIFIQKITRRILYVKRNGQFVIIIVI